MTTITLTLSEEEYNLLLNMLFNANPIIQKIAQQANPQLAAAQQQKAEPPRPEPPKPVDRLPERAQERR